MTTPQTPTAIGRKNDRQFSRVKKLAEKMRLERTGLLPDRSEEFMSLQFWYKDYVNEYRQTKMAQNDLDMGIAKQQNREFARVYGGKTIGDCNTAILGLKTVWARGWTATDSHPEAPWPTYREFREEGDERHTSNYGRFLPIPRVPGNKTVVYKQKSFVPVELLDVVMPVPKLYGMVNINMFGFFDTEVDVNGVPYDDDSLPGDEYVIQRKDVAAGVGPNSVASQRKVVSGLAPIGPPEVGAADFYFGWIQETPSRGQKKSTIQATAPPFVPRNIPALNPGGVRAHTEDGQDQFIKKDFNGPLVDTFLNNTAVQAPKDRPEVVGFTDPWKVKHVIKANLQINTKVKEFHGNMSPKSKHGAIKNSAFNAMLNMSPGTAFRAINDAQNKNSADTAGYSAISAANSSLTTEYSIHSRSRRESQDMLTSAETKSSHDSLGSPLGFRRISSFSSCKPRSHKPAPLKLKPRRRQADVIKIINFDDDDEEEEDGGVVLC